MKPKITIFTVFAFFFTSCATPTAIPTLTPTTAPTFTPTPAPTATPAYLAFDQQSLEQWGLSADNLTVWQDQDGKWWAGEKKGDKKLTIGESKDWELVSAELSAEQQMALKKMQESFKDIWDVDSKTGEVTNMDGTKIPYLKYNFETGKMDFSYPYHFGLEDQDDTKLMTESYGPGGISPYWDKDKKAYIEPREVGVFNLTENGWERQNFIGSNGKEIEGLKVYSGAEVWAETVNDYSTDTDYDPTEEYSNEYFGEMLAQVPREVGPDSMWRYTYGGMYEVPSGGWGYNKIPVVDPQSGEVSWKAVSKYKVQAIGSKKQYAFYWTFDNFKSFACKTKQESTLTNL